MSASRLPIVDRLISYGYPLPLFTYVLAISVIHPVSVINRLLAVYSFSGASIQQGCCPLDRTVAKR